MRGDMDLGNVALRKSKLLITKYRGEEKDNLYIFSHRFNTGDTTAKKPFHLTAKNILIENGRFSFTDYNLEYPKSVDYRDLKIDAEDLVILDSKVAMRVHDLEFEAAKGYGLTGLEGNFEYTPETISLQNMQLTANNSQINADLLIETGEGAFEDFVNRAVFDLNILESSLSTTDLEGFYTEFVPGQEFDISGRLTGPLNDFTITDLNLSGLSGSSIQGDVEFHNLLEAVEGFRIDGNFSELQTSFIDLNNFLPGLLRDKLPEFLVRAGRVNYKGAARVTENTLYANGKLITSLGTMTADLQLNNIQNPENIAYRGTVKGEKLNVGRLLEIPKLGRSTFDVVVDGKGFSAEALNTTINGNISSLNYNDYRYTGISVSGILRNPRFDGSLIIEDKNARLTFNGLIDNTKAINKYDFTTEIEYIDLAALNFTKDSLGILKGRVVMDMQGTGVEDATGSIQFYNSSFQNDNDIYVFDDFRVTSSFKGPIRTIDINSPDIINGTATGNFKIAELGPLFRNAISSLYTNYEPEITTESQFINFDFEIYNKIVEVFVPKIRFEGGTEIRGSVVSDASEFKLNFISPEIEAYGIFAQAIELQVDNKNTLYNTYIEADTIGSGIYGISDFSLINVTLKDTLFMRSEFFGGPTGEDVYDLSMYHTINEENNSVVGFRKSGIKFKDNQWYLNPVNNTLNRMIFHQGLTDIDIDKFLFSHDREQITLSGQLRDSTYKDLTADFESVRLSHITPYIDSLDMRGLVNGSLNLLQEKGAYYPNSNVVIDSLHVNDVALGKLVLDVRGDASLTNFVIDTKLTNDGLESLSAKGKLTVGAARPTIDMDVQLRKLNLAAFSPLGGEVLSDIRGLASGRASVTGDYVNPDISGELLLRDAGMGIPFLKTDYDFVGTSRIRLSGQEFNFVQVQLEDTKFRTRGELRGTISHQLFNEWELDLDITTDRLNVLDTEKDRYALYYGTAFISGQASIAGPTDELVIDVMATTERGTVFKVPLNDTQSFGDASIIYFLSPEEKQARAKGEAVEVKEIKGLALNFDLEVTRDAEVEIVVDPENGSTLKGRGAGFLLIEINTNGKFNMFGDFTPYEGYFNFRYSGIVQKQFEIVPDGKISWDGRPEGALLDISAIYRAQANPSILLENPSINRKIPVGVMINLDGELMQPDITFDFEFPNTSSVVTSELEYRLNDRATRELQAFSLITQGSFYSPNLFNGQGVVAGNLIETASGIFNNLLSSEDSKFNIGIDVVQADNLPDVQTAGRVGFSLSTQISNRVIINGKVGVPTGGINQSAVVGDVEVSFLLNEDGTLRATVFNRQSDIQFVGEANSYTQGAGINYSVDFSTLKELFSKILRGKATRIEEASIEIIPADSEIPFDGLKTSY